MEWLLKFIGIKQKIELAHDKKNEYTVGMARIHNIARSMQKKNEEILSITQGIAIATGAKKKGRT